MCIFSTKWTSRGNKLLFCNFISSSKIIANEKMSFSAVPIINFRIRMVFCLSMLCSFLALTQNNKFQFRLNMACRVWNRIVTEGFSIIDYKMHLMSYKDYMLSVGTELDGELHTFSNISNTNKLSFYESKTRKLRDGRLKGLRNKL